MPNGTADHRNVNGNRAGSPGSGLLTDRHNFTRLALLASDTERAIEAEAELRGLIDWVPIEDAEAVVVLGGDGFMLQTLHHMLDNERVIPAYGLNLGTVGFLMNKQRSRANSSPA